MCIMDKVKKKKYLHIFQSTHQVDMKNNVDCHKDFFGYFNALETYSRVKCQHERVINHLVSYNLVC